MADVARQLPLTAPAFQTVVHPTFGSRQLNVQMLRLDAMHPTVSGNKWYKLKFNLAQAIQLRAKTLITFGGAWSNHLHAFSYMGQRLGMKTVAVVRGEEWQQQRTPLLADIERWGTELLCVPRHTYRRRHDADYQRELLSKFQQPFLIPEGGDNFYGILGVASLCDDLAPHDRRTLSSAHQVALACGTGNTFVGLRLALPQRQRLLGVAALKGSWYSPMIAQKLQRFWPLNMGNWQILSEFHGGGFAKMPPYLQQWQHAFQAHTQIPLDPVYTTKLCYAIESLSQQGYFAPGQTIALIHTGGLQGRRSQSEDSTI